MPPVRFATLLWYVLKANRECGTKHALARKLYIIGDNFSENRNWCSCMHFSTEIVWHNWFDEVYNCFGPVGHTHNGIDGRHNQHNTDLQKTAFPYLGDMLEGFSDVWYASPSPHVTTTMQLDTQRTRFLGRRMFDLNIAYWMFSTTG